tara:strand:+ start:1611 stop:2030 length:420 start_codon:yes stop_codon:yes gene_type:complete
VKQTASKILSLFLACSVLISTTSFASSAHFCCNKLVSYSVTGKAKPCDQKLQNPKNTSRKCSLEQKDCCSTDTYANIGKDDLMMDSFDLDFDTLVFLHAFIFYHIDRFEGLQENVIPFKDYDPPWIEQDLLVLHETFLI